MERRKGGAGRDVCQPDRRRLFLSGGRGAARGRGWKEPLERADHHLDRLDGHSALSGEPDRGRVFRDPAADAEPDAERAAAGLIYGLDL